MRLNKQSEEGHIGKVPRPDRESLLLLVHLQNDFCPGGALAVPGGDEIIPLINQYISFFVSQGSSVLATRDWHPANHCSFVEQGGSWPPHCIQGSRGSQFHPDLRLPTGMMIVTGATNPKQEAYSGFDGTSLEERLEDLGAKTLYVVGLATDYCVKQTVLDACKRGFRVVVLEDAVRGIDVEAGDSQKAIEEMVGAGAIKATGHDVGINTPS
jgi:nicotinamidase/pyrazinamidase